MQRTEALTLADAVFPRLQTDSRVTALARDFALMTGFALFVALCAQLMIRTPWSPVPITGQTFAVLVTGGALGAWRGAGSLSIYMLIGMIGLPAFAPGEDIVAGSWDLHFILPWDGNDGPVWDFSSGGYIVGFIFAAALVGFLSERGWDRKPYIHLGFLLGNAILYIPGIAWLAYDLDVSLQKGLEYGLYPYIVGDMMKLFLASLTLPVAWGLVSRFKGKDSAGPGSAAP